MFFLLRLSLAVTSADLIPPFELDANGMVNYWEFGGSSIVQDNYVMLATPVQYNKGFMWTNAELPSGEWSVRLQLHIHSGTGGGGFGIWFVDKYGEIGPIHGGPSNFRGIGVIATVVSDRQKSKFSLNFSILQNKGDETYDIKNLPNNFKSVNLDRSQPFDVILEFKDNMKKLNVYYEISNTTNKQKREPILTHVIDVPMKDNYMGVTAQSDAYTSRFDVKLLKFKLHALNEDKSKKEENKRTNKLSKNDPHGHYSPKDKSLLRNPVFDITLTEINDYYNTRSKDTDRLNEAGAGRVLDVINELNSASYDVASFKELNSFVTQTLMPYSQKWQKRTLKIVEQVQETRNIVSAAWNYTHKMINDMNSTIKINSVKATFKVIDLAELLTSEADSAFENTHDLAEQSTLVKLLVIVSVFEFVAAVSFLVAIQFSSVRSKLFGPEM